MTTWTTTIFWTIASGMSIFYGLKAADIFEVSFKDKSRPFKFHQIWLNLLGSLTGWYFTWTLTTFIINSEQNSVGLEIGMNRLFIFLIAFIGITGHLPMTIIGLVTSFKEIVAKLLGLLK